MQRQRGLQALFCIFSQALLMAHGAPAPFPASAPLRSPNIIILIADDVGWCDWGCYGQSFIQTPNIDRLCKNGMRFTHYYAGAPTGVPSACSLLTGKHTGHAAIRFAENTSAKGQIPLPQAEETLAEALRKAGYATAAFGKWVLGPMGSEGSPLRQGFDTFFGTDSPSAAHNHYPPFLWNQNTRVALNNPYFPAHQIFIGNELDPDDFARFSGNDYAPDRVAEAALAWIRKHKATPFFLYWASTLPHAALQAPPEAIEAYADLPEKRPYLGAANYLPHQRPRSAYAAMVSRFDRYVGEVLRCLTELELEHDTLLLVTADNGPAVDGGADPAFFQSTGGLRGAKGDLYEGGIRVPLLAYWKGTVAPESECRHPCAAYDLFASCVDLLQRRSQTGRETVLPSPTQTDGISLLPTLTGSGEQPLHPFLYWETNGKAKALRMGNRKAVQRTPFGPLQLFDLEADPNETRNLALKEPATVAKIRKMLKEAHTPSARFPMTGDSLFYGTP